MLTAGHSFVEAKALPDIDSNARQTVAAFTTTTGAVGPTTRAYLSANAVENARRADRSAQS